MGDKHSARWYWLENCKAVVHLVPNVLWPFWGQPVGLHVPGPHVTDATRNPDYISIDSKPAPHGTMKVVDSEVTPFDDPTNM